MLHTHTDSIPLVVVREGTLCRYVGHLIVHVLFVCVHVYVCVYMCICVCVCVCMYMCVCTCVYVVGRCAFSKSSRFEALIVPIWQNEGKKIHTLLEFFKCL